VQEHRNLFLGGRWAASQGGTVRTVISPATEAVIGRVVLGSELDIDAAVRAARQAFDEGPWPRMHVDERRSMLRRAGDILTAMSEELNRLVSSENGAPIRAKAAYPGAHFAYYTSLDLPPQEYRVAPDGSAALIVHEPVGVVGAIMPWNAPVGLSLHTILPALLAGCTVVLKPAPETPLHSFPMAQAFLDAGLPEGVLSIVPCDRQVSEALVRHPGVDMISFVGSTAAGERIGAVCAGQVKRVRLELGGKSAAILLEDADVNVAVPAVLNGGLLLNNGQTCASWSRILVPNSRYDEIVDAMREVASRATIGDPLDPATTLGPLVSEAQRTRVENYIRSGKDEGAKIAVGGGRPAGLNRGWYVEPTIFVHADNSMRIAREEIFGPVNVILGYDDEEQAIAIANDSDYGLAGAVFTSDHRRGVQVAQQIRTGTVGVNCFGYGLAFPFGGYKRSGIGREHGPESIREVMETKTIGLPRDHDVAAFRTCGMAAGGPAVRLE
jgi:aldehyde dehydrogenase (NAD+)